MLLRFTMIGIKILSQSCPNLAWDCHCGLNYFGYSKYKYLFSCFYELNSLGCARQRRMMIFSFYLPLVISFAQVPRNNQKSKHTENMLNNNTTKTIGAFLAVAALSSGAAMAEIEGDIYAGYATQYNFRGVNNGDDLGEAGVNLSTKCPLTGGTITAGVWYGSVNADDLLLDNQMISTLGISKQFDAVDVGFGFIRYDFDNGGRSFFSDTSEIYLSAATDLYAGVRGKVAAYYDVEINDGWYLEGTLSKSFEINETVDLTVTGGLSVYQSHAFNTDGLNQLFVTVAMPWAVKDNVTLTPYVKYSDVDSDQFSGINGGDLDGGDNEFFGGIRLSVSF